MNYKTIIRLHAAEIEEKKSRFIAHLVPLDAFDKTLDKLRVQHRKANHHVTAFRRMHDNGLIQEIGKDDGEPSGTSGMPVLKTMIGADLMDAGIIVTRYFGGVKLGTGGLARAYSGAANAAIHAAELVKWVQLTRLEISVTFDQTAAIERQIEQNCLTVISRNYTETGVDIMVEGEKEKIANLAQHGA